MPNMTKLSYLQPPVDAIARSQILAFLFLGICGEARQGQDKLNKLQAGKDKLDKLQVGQAAKRNAIYLIRLNMQLLTILVLAS